MKESCKSAYDKFKAVALSEAKEYIEKLNYEKIYTAAVMIREAEAKSGRIHISGIGKCSYVAGYVASLMSSTDTPAYFLHAPKPCTARADNSAKAML